MVKEVNERGPALPREEAPPSRERENVRAIHEQTGASLDRLAVAPELGGEKTKNPHFS